jgi:hypothetical protein
MQRFKGDAMKEVPKKQLPEISGGDYVPTGSDSQLPTPSTDVDFPRNPLSPVFEAPYAIEE